jgi:general secretion pathway protein G
MHKQQNRESGMSLIEIIIVMALISGVMAVIMGSVAAGNRTAKEREAELAFGNLRTAINMYRLATNKVPTTEQGLKALIENPGVSNWHGPYCEADLLKDPWGNDIRYESDGKKMHFTSAGDDEKFDTEDDITWPHDEAKPAG